MFNQAISRTQGNKCNNSTRPISKVIQVSKMITAVSLEARMSSGSKHPRESLTIQAMLMVSAIDDPHHPFTFN